MVPAEALEAKKTSSYPQHMSATERRTPPSSELEGMWRKLLVPLGLAVLSGSGLIPAADRSMFSWNRSYNRDEPIIGNSDSRLKNKFSILQPKSLLWHSHKCTYEQRLDKSLYPEVHLAPHCIECYTNGTAVDAKICKLRATPISLPFHRTLRLNYLNLFPYRLLTK